MAEYKKKILKLSKGQISPELIERTDIGLLDSSAQEITNFINSKYGLLRTIQGTSISYNFGTNKAVRLFNVNLADGTPCILSINATDNQIRLHDAQGVAKSSIASALSLFTSGVLNRVRLAQSNDIIILSIPNRPMYRLNVNSTGSVISLSLFAVSADKIIKVSTLSSAVINSIFHRFSGSLPADPATQNMEIGDYAQISATGTPPTSFPVSVYRLDAFPDTEHWTISTAVISDVGDTPYYEITDAIINNPGSGYTDQDVLTEPISGATFTYNSGSGTLTIDNPTAQYVSDPAGTNLSLTGGTGVGMTVDITSFYYGYTPGETITDVDSGATFTLGTIGVGQSLTIDNPAFQYSTDPAGVGKTTSGGGGSGLKITLTSATIPTQWTSTTYTALSGDYCKNHDGNIYIYSNSTWQLVDATVTDRQYNTSYRVTAVAGLLDAIFSTYITITKPTSYPGTPAEYAQRLIIGCDFDGLEGLGIFRIQAITGTIVGNDYRITKMSGITQVEFLATGTYYPAFVLKYSMQPAFDSNVPGTLDNLHNTTNYPIYIFFYQQRLWILGTTNDATQLVCSNLGIYDDFSDDYSGASTNSFQLRIAGTEKEIVQTGLINQGLQIYTDKGEWVIQGSSITSSSGFIKNSSIGSGPVQPIISGGGTSLFIPGNGLGLVSLMYSADFLSYQTPYVSFLTDAIDSPIIDMCLKRGFSSTDDTLIFLCLQNGKIIIANYLAEQQVQSFIVRQSNNTYYQQAIQPSTDVLYLTKRNNYTLIEKQDSTKNTEASIDSFAYNNNTGLLSSLHTSYNGLDINVYDGDGNFVEEVTVSGNQATLTAPFPSTVSEVGFNIHNVLESNPININAETYNLYKTIKSVKIALTKNSKGNFLKVSGKSASRNKDNFLTFIRPVKPSRECIYTIENDRYILEIMSIELDVEA